MAESKYGKCTDCVHCSKKNPHGRPIRNGGWCEVRNCHVSDNTGCFIDFESKNEEA